MKNNNLLIFLSLILLCAIHQLSLAQWVRTSATFGGPIRVLAVGHDTSGRSNLFAAADHKGVFLTSNSGTNWTPADSGLTDFSVLAIAISGSTLFAGTALTGIYRSTNNGTYWTKLDQTFYRYGGFWSLVISGENIFAGTSGSGVLLSTDKGANWIPVNSGLTDLFVRSLVASGTNLFAGTVYDGIFLSTNNGTNWTPINSGLTNPSTWSLVVSGTNLFAATYYRVFFSSNNGTSWVTIKPGLSDTTLYTLVLSDTNLFAGADGGGIFLSTNNGTSWTAVNSGLPPGFYVLSLAVSDSNLFAGDDSGVVWKRPLSEMIPDKLNNDDIPSTFSLSQNYPNPFNPATTISFTLPSKSFVSLTIFDLLGREKTTLVSGELDAGHFTRQWNATNESSGVYFCRLSAAGYVETKKLMLIK